MISGWFSFKNIQNTNLLELKGFQISQIAADATGRFVALCGTNELVLSPLKNPSNYSAFSLPSKSGCSGLAWHPNDSTRLAVVRSNKCELLVWDANECRLSTSTSLGGYVRVINSLDWSPMHPFLLATTSADQFRAICVWDLRDLSRPIRAMESLSSPILVKWNRFLSGKFATCHSSGVRVWDLRTSVPQQYLSVQGDAIRDFDWSPKNTNQLVTISDDPQLCLWDIENASCPVKKVRLHDIKMRKVLYTPSGDHIVILPEQSYWPVHGITVWTSATLTQSYDLFLKKDNTNANNTGDNQNLKTSTGGNTSTTTTTTATTTTTNTSVSSNTGFLSASASSLSSITTIVNTAFSSNPTATTTTTTSNATGATTNNPVTNNHLCDESTCQPYSTDSYILDMNWLVFSPNILLPQNDDETPTVVTPPTTTNFLLDNEMAMAYPNLDYCPRKLTHLLTWSVDQVLRGYPIHSRTIAHHDTEPATNQSSKQNRITQEESTGHILEDNTILKTSHSKKTGCTTTSSSNKSKPFELQIRGEDFCQRSSISKSNLSVSAIGGSADIKNTNQEDSAFQFLAQELSLLSPRAGQYKLEEVDLINRTAKLILFYCRRKHYHHYTLCSITNALRRRRHSADINNEGLDSLLLPSTTDLISQMELSEHSNLWITQHHRDSLSSSGDIDSTALNDINFTGECNSQTNIQATNNMLNHCSSALTMSNQSIKIVNDNDSNISSLAGGGMPLAGSIILSVEFPVCYPLGDALPEFHILDCNPSLPADVLDELKNVLHSTASEFVLSSRGCVEPCIRNAVITLQTYPVSHSQIERNSSSVSSKLVHSSSIRYDINDDTLTKISSLHNNQPDEIFMPSGETIIKRKGKHAAIGIPFPRTSGVHFTINGLLVMFGISETLSSIRATLKSTPVSMESIANHDNNNDNRNKNQNNNNNPSNTKDWTPRSFNDYQIFMHQFTSIHQEYSTDMKKSFQNCIGSIIDSFVKLEENSVEKKAPTEEAGTGGGGGEGEQMKQQKRCLNNEMIHDKVSLSPYKVNLPGSRNSFDTMENNKSGKNSSESIQDMEQKWINPLVPSICPNFVDPKYLTKLIPGQFSTVYPSTVQIYDLSPLIWDRHLMYEYSLNTDNLQRLCTHNLNVVLHTHRKDLIRFWQYALVLSVSFDRSNNIYQTCQPLASQLIGRPLFNTWIKHFLRIHDIQSLAMAVLVLQSLHRINELQLDNTCSSTGSLNNLNAPTKAQSSNMMNNISEIKSKNCGNELEKTNNCLRYSTLSNTILEKPVSFTLDDSEDIPADELSSTCWDRSNENMNNCCTSSEQHQHQPGMNELSVNSIYAHQSRFIHSKDLFPFHHYISVYASIIYSLREYILHARLLRSWSSSYMHKNALPYIWPYIQSSALILLSCPDNQSTSNLLPKQSNNDQLKSIQCTQYQWEMNVDPDNVVINTRQLLICSICRNTSKGLVLICPRCNHGGHVHHIYTWFNSINSVNNNYPKQCPFINCNCFCSTDELINSSQIVQVQ
uniref:WD_REPEATS_REGION domain-containing protein n=1 Tax=Trichobilharzia regenti TaxID=157069 RepID=A0AA85JS53_TRIRE|nr:unnamed protein product [Trichobilharzia regenti]